MSQDLFDLDQLRWMQVGLGRSSTGINRIHELIYGNDNRLLSSSVVMTRYYTVLIHFEATVAMVLPEN